MDAVTQRVYQPLFTLIYEQKDITHAITPYLIELSYRDFLDGQADEVEVSLEDTDGAWLYDWYPDAGDGIELSLADEMGQMLPMGRFEITEIEYRYPPSVISIKALSAGPSKARRTNQPKPYTKTTLAAIIREVAGRLNLSITGQIRDVKIDSVTQYQERDMEFLARLAATFGHSFKMVNETLVFYDNQALGDRDAVARIDKTAVIEMSFKDLIKDVPNEVTVSSHNTKNNTTKTAKKTVKPKRGKGKKATTDTLKITAPNNATQDEVNAMADAHAKKSEDEQIAAEISLTGNPLLVAGQVVMLEQMGKFSGKYLIKEAKHELSVSGYTTDIELRMLEYIDPMMSQTTQSPNDEPSTESV